MKKKRWKIHTWRDAESIGKDHKSIHVSIIGFLVFPSLEEQMYTFYSMYLNLSPKTWKRKRIIRALKLISTARNGHIVHIQKEPNKVSSRRVKIILVLVDLSLSLPLSMCVQRYKFSRGKFSRLQPATNSLSCPQGPIYALPLVEDSISWHEDNGKLIERVLFDSVSSCVNTLGG